MEWVLDFRCRNFEYLASIGAISQEFGWFWILSWFRSRCGVAIADLEGIGVSMNRCAMQQPHAFAACEENRATFAVAERRPPVFCPKPRRLSPLSAVADPVRPLWWHSSYQIDFSDSKAGADLLDIFQLTGGDQNQVASSPPFFSGSPPSRASNPVVHDSRFCGDRPPAPFASSPLIQSNSPISPNYGFTIAKFGLVPAAIRVEGFDCLDRGRRRSCSSITAVA
ncbi:uncharacterized protein LOC121970975 isoform X1 [Zingiber officinale]|nr:uncharacterized protein LOC121970975 isoform X1 [Zingiber officinale]